MSLRIELMPEAQDKKETVDLTDEDPPSVKAVREVFPGARVMPEDVEDPRTGDCNAS